jgi:Lrp/AsnC family transcriptional regulator, leucine-responsive regulatory protein
MTYILDDKDKKILEVLEEHGDYTTRQIAKKTLLPITTIHNRIQKLKKEKIIRKFTVDIEPKAVDKALLVYILVSVNLEHLKKLKKSQYDVAKELRRFDFTEKVDVVAGNTDLVLVVRVKDIAEYDKVLLTKIQMVEGIKETTSMIVIHER